MNLTTTKNTSSAKPNHCTLYTGIWRAYAPPPPPPPPLLLVARRGIAPASDPCCPPPTFCHAKRAAGLPGSAGCDPRAAHCIWRVCPGTETSPSWRAAWVCLCALCCSVHSLPEWWWGGGGWLSSLTAVFYGPWSTFRGYEIDIKMLIFWYWLFCLNSRLYFSMKNYLSNLTFFCFLRAHNLGLCKLYVASQCVANFSRCILTAASPWKMYLKTWHKKGSSSFGII